MLWDASAAYGVALNVDGGKAQLERLLTRRRHRFQRADVDLLFVNAASLCPAATLSRRVRGGLPCGSLCKPEPCEHARRDERGNAAKNERSQGHPSSVSVSRSD